MTIIKNTSPVIKRDGSPAMDHVIRVYRRDTGAFLTETLTANNLGTFKTLSWVDTANSSGWDGYTARNVIDKNILEAGTRIRITIKSASSAGLQIGAAYVGIAPSSGTVYDFDTTPSQLLFSGVSTATVSAGASVVSDWLAYGYTGSNNLVVSLYFSGSSDIRTSPALGGWSGYYVASNSVNTVGATGYTSVGNIYAVTTIEINNTALAPGQYIANCGSYVGDTNVVCLDQTGTSNDLILRSNTT